MRFGQIRKNSQKFRALRAHSCARINVRYKPRGSSLSPPTQPPSIISVFSQAVHSAVAWGSPPTPQCTCPCIRLTTKAVALARTSPVALQVVYKGLRRRARVRQSRALQSASDAGERQVSPPCLATCELRAKMPAIGRFGAPRALLLYCKSLTDERRQSP